MARGGSKSRVAMAMACDELGWLWSRLGAGPEERGAREMTMMPTRTGAAKLSPSAPLNLVVSAAAPLARSRALRLRLRLAAFSHPRTPFRSLAAFTIDGPSDRRTRAREESERRSYLVPEKSAAMCMWLGCGCGSIPSSENATSCLKILGSCSLLTH